MEPSHVAINSSIRYGIQPNKFWLWTRWHTRLLLSEPKVHLYQLQGGRHERDDDQQNPRHIQKTTYPVSRQAKEKAVSVILKRRFDYSYQHVLSSPYEIELWSRVPLQAPERLWCTGYCWVCTQFLATGKYPAWYDTL